MEKEIKYKITIFKNSNLNNGETSEKSMVAQSSIVGSKEEFTNFKELVYTLRDNTSIMAELEGNRRAGTNFKTSNILALDFDGGITKNEVIKNLNTQGLKFGLYSSFNDGKKDKIKFRVIIPLTDEITNAKDYTRTVKYIQTLIPGSDPKTKDASRLFFHGKKQSEVLFNENEGNLFDIRNVPEEKEKIITTSKIHTENNTENPILNELYLELIKEKNPAKDGEGGNGTTYEVACELVRGLCMDDETALHFLNKYNDKCKPPWSEKELKTFINNARKYGEGELGYLKDKLMTRNKVLKKIIQSSNLIMDTLDQSKTVVVNLNNGITYPIKPFVISNIMGDREYEIYMVTKSFYALFVYEPFKKQLVFTNEEFSMMNCYNTYRPPKWLHEYFFHDKPIEINKEIPEIYKKFFYQLVNENSNSYNFLLDWMANSIKRKNLTFLVLAGSKGIGKGLLGTILENIHGEHNYVGVRDEILKGRFNGQIADKTLIHIDEMNIKYKNEVDKLKALVNDKIEIEAKGKDAIMGLNNASIYITTNNLDSIPIEGDSRRYSAIDLTDEGLVDSDLYKENPNIVEDLFNKDNINKLCQYLFHRDIKSEMNKPFKGARYEEIIDEGLKDWQLSLLNDFCKDNIGKEFTINEVQEWISLNCLDLDRPPGRRKLIDTSNIKPGFFRIKRIDNIYKFEILYKKEGIE